MSHPTIVPPRQRVLRGERVVALLGVLLVSFALLAVPKAEVDAVADGLEVSELEYPKDSEYANVAGIDEVNRRLYVFVRPRGLSIWSIAVYDLRPATPKLLKVSEPGVTTAGSFSPYKVVIDGAKQRMLVINTMPSNGTRPQIDVIDLKTLTLTETWDLSTRVPGFVPRGFTQDAAANRLYVVGDFTLTPNVASVSKSFGMNQVPQGAAVIALEADTGAFVWVNLMPKCDNVLDGFNLGSLVGLSRRTPTLYVFCMGGSTAWQPTGQNGLIRMDITDQNAAAGVAEFPMDFFPISGSYFETSTTTGVAAFDPGSERFFAQSLASRTPGAWVFDGLRDSWVGFIAAPKNNNMFFGLNPANGRYYMGGYGGYQSPNGYVTVTDGRTTPVAQGTVYEGLYLDGQVVSDPATNRLFAPLHRPGPPDEFGNPERIYGVMMLRDNSRPITPLPAVDLDQLTKDLPDDKALLQFSAGASGFGARYSVIGGWESIWDRIKDLELIPVRARSSLGDNPGQLAYGDRGLTFAAIPAVDIRPAGASATAAASSLDQATRSDRTDRENELKSRGATVPEPPEDAPVKTLAGGLTCLDGGGKRLEDQQGGDDPERVRVVCDLDKLTAEGFASYAENIRGGGQMLGSSSFDTKTFRDPKRGVVTQTTATARGLSLSDPSGAGRVTIDRVTAVATTSANGRPGTTTATWTRTVEGVVLTDSNGDAQKQQSCTTTVVQGKQEISEGNCSALQRQINSLSSRLEVRFPLPKITATPRGAFARVEERETDYLNSLTTNNDQSRAVPAMELVVHNDGPEKGRLLVQYAAIDANAIFTRSGLFDSFPTGTTTVIPNGGTSTEEGGDTGTTAGTPGTTTTTPGTFVPGSGATGSSAAGGGVGVGEGGVLSPAVATGAGGILGAPGTTGTQPVLGWLIGARTPREAALAIGIWLLFASALSSVWRRRRLIETVGN